MVTDFNGGSYIGSRFGEQQRRKHDVQNRFLSYSFCGHIVWVISKTIIRLRRLESSLSASPNIINLVQESTGTSPSFRWNRSGV